MMIPPGVIESRSIEVQYTLPEQLTRQLIAVAIGKTHGMDSTDHGIAKIDRGEKIHFLHSDSIVAQDRTSHGHVENIFGMTISSKRPPSPLIRCSCGQGIFIFQAIALVPRSTRYIVPKSPAVRGAPRNISGCRSIAKDSGSAKSFCIVQSQFIFRTKHALEKIVLLITLATRLDKSAQPNANCIC
jgi:hypothetical protein